MLINYIKGNIKLSHNCIDQRGVLRKMSHKTPLIQRSRKFGIFKNKQTKIGFKNFSVKNYRETCLQWNF